LSGVESVWKVVALAFLLYFGSFCLFVASFFLATISPWFLLLTIPFLGLILDFFIRAKNVRR